MKYSLQPKAVSETREQCLLSFVFTKTFTRVFAVFVEDKGAQYYMRRLLITTHISSWVEPLSSSNNAPKMLYTFLFLIGDPHVMQGL